MSKKRKSGMADPARIQPFDGDQKNVVHVVIETPKGSRNKFKYEPDLGTFTLHTLLPEGMVFPYDFGFIPCTKAEDGDPIDVLLLMDEPVFAGCVVPSRLIGVLEAEQTEKDGEKERNDRLLAVSLASREHTHLKTIDEVSGKVLEEIQQFFKNYNQQSGKQYKPVGRKGPKQAMKLVEKSLLKNGKK
ncbi:MAG TPA: inorganic diphosphatase [Terriglobales bacterium]|nr:inorganic diphosphatase [Terriglobales bacterium]